MISVNTNSTPECCSYKNSLRCTRCRKRGHCVKNCPDKHFLRFQVPTFLEQLIPENLRVEYGITTQSLLQPSNTELIEPNLMSPKFLEDLISSSDIQKYRIGTRTRLPREQGGPKPIHKAMYEVVNTASFFRHRVMCHGEQPSQIMENNLGFTLGYALRQTYTLNQIQQEAEVTMKEEVKYLKFQLSQMRMRIKRMKAQMVENRKDEFLRENSESLKELEKEILTDEKLTKEFLMRELIKKCEEQFEEAEMYIEECKGRLVNDYKINNLPSEQELKLCREKVLDLEKKRAKKAKQAKQEEIRRNE